MILKIINNHACVILKTQLILFITRTVGKNFIIFYLNFDNSFKVLKDSNIIRKKTWKQFRDFYWLNIS